MGHSQEWDPDTTQAIESLLHLLILHSGRTPPPPPSAACTIVKALSGSGDISFAAFTLLTKSPTWFMEPDFSAIILRSGVWAHLGRSFNGPIRISTWKWVTSLQRLLNGNPRSPLIS
jgi:hypothetical protein